MRSLLPRLFLLACMHVCNSDALHVQMYSLQAEMYYGNSVPDYTLDTLRSMRTRPPTGRFVLPNIDMPTMTSDAMIYQQKGVLTLLTNTSKRVTFPVPFVSEPSVVVTPSMEHVGCNFSLRLPQEAAHIGFFDVRVRFVSLCISIYLCCFHLVFLLCFVLRFPSLSPPLILPLFCAAV